MIAKLLSLFLLASPVIAQDTSLAEVKGAFNRENIPADTTTEFNPTTLLEVTFPQSSGPPVRVRAGVQLKRNQTAIPPTFAIQPSLSSRTPSGPFVVAMVDLDALTPQMPNLSQIRHFLGGNFRLSPSFGLGLEPLRNSTPAISDFMQPTPPAGSDPHRYVFYLFNQPRNFNAQTIVTPSSSITNFNISQFSEEVGLGSPLGGSFILVGPDPASA